ncbi:hypothetical protein CD191_06930 [Paenibacillus odorifer]|uniref:tRNA nuclease CdiA C-terminal domain-containing protein n=2 Tax=Paenibacillus odorifer TaxID=189426 RepID=A0AAD0P1S6_9BACL|nr:hypothetical protein CD191_06930 [Paenibacillus odorifer]
MGNSSYVDLTSLTQIQLTAIITDNNQPKATKQAAMDEIVRRNFLLIENGAYIAANGVKSAVNSIKGFLSSEKAVKMGKFIGSMDGLTNAERQVIGDLVGQGKTVEVIQKTTSSKTPDFLVNGIKTELKTLENANINTGITRIQKGFKQGAQTVIIDGRNAGVTESQAYEIINRAKGTYSNKTLPGTVEIWITGGKITFP